MVKCGDCVHFQKCSHCVTPEEMFSEVGGCSAFKKQSNFVEVVRCKDCRKWEYDEDFSGWCAEWRKRTLGDHFCSYGEMGDDILMHC